MLMWLEKKERKKGIEGGRKKEEGERRNDKEKEG
jgi:hypothetical protein